VGRGLVSLYSVILHLYIFKAITVLSCPVSKLQEFFACILIFVQQTAEKQFVYFQLAFSFTVDFILNPVWVIVAMVM